jgi:hypothetical protein
VLSCLAPSFIAFAGLSGRSSQRNLRARTASWAPKEPDTEAFATKDRSCGETFFGAALIRKQDLSSRGLYDEYPSTKIASSTASSRYRQNLLYVSPREIMNDVRSRCYTRRTTVSTRKIPAFPGYKLTEKSARAQNSYARASPLSLNCKRYIDSMRSSVSTSSGPLSSRMRTMRGKRRA